MKIYIRPLSVNQGFQGRRFKNKAYKDYEQELLYLLPKPKKMLMGSIGIDLRFGLEKRSYAKSDTDNMIKFFIDCLAKKGYFKNDSQICEIIAKKLCSDRYYIQFEVTLFSESL